ncbi:2-dehydro-3-deoxy-phosphogluconate aldolase [Limoniibacter endophyticus]|uniref:2-dehydro-3-deoxy-phosphogluconate aldolase n=1 Tax=Limoniibacter endophyticus TaxID=1565040 RepID=A0A8J3DGB3_9HYPH|nr:2-dehydro-3-deoxy-phosphogluconate aldolase [Limoniibacter endophyticus]GHC64346.1 2-dehydro-3-deoxy-phosphogluconate aldolase [Limoniibacter endophyticus]
MTSGSARMKSLLGQQKVVPVIKIDDLENAVPLARALASGGLPLIEVTLRTKAALDCIRKIAAEVPEAVVGAGTILSPSQFDEAVSAGSKFIVSPGVTVSLLKAAEGNDVPLLPGAITPGEIMLAREAGLDFLKFFPAEQAGGADFIKSLASPFAGISFCPTGGVSLANASSYLSLPNVVCVGGSWVAPDKLVAAKDWEAITQLARDAAKL